ncbi:MAG: hemerythrin domain-containing protein [Alphaproteobacteria bacterium]|nr:hemerythrin domain-containing protein [Alphaproteobacteria bacterium]
MSDRQKPLVWKPEISVGHLGLDGEHRYFIELLNRLALLLVSKAPLQEVIELLVILEAETEIHFQHEEQVLEQTDYPLIEDHADRHRVLLESIIQTRHALESRTQADMTAEAKRIDDLRTRMIEHILSEDMSIRQHMESKRD